MAYHLTAASLNLQRRTLGHLSAVYCVVFDCTGRYVITGADDMLVKVSHLLIQLSLVFWEYTVSINGQKA